MAAGGMGRRPDLGTLAERSARARGVVQPAPPPAVPDPPPLRHCWVTGDDGPLPALLLGWERRATGWHGRVVHPVLEPDGWVVVEEWLPAAMLEPAERRGTRSQRGHTAVGHIDSMEDTRE